MSFIPLIILFVIVGGMTDTDKNKSAKHTSQTHQEEKDKKQKNEEKDKDRDKKGKKDDGSIQHQAKKNHNLNISQITKTIKVRQRT